MTEDWRPYCGAEYPHEKTAGDIIVCDRPVHDFHRSKHRNEELGFEWWGEEAFEHEA